MVVGEIRPPADHPTRGLWVLEVQQARLLERVDRQDLRAALLRLLEVREHPRVVGSGIVPLQHDQIGLVDVLEDHAGLAYSDRFGERDRRRLVAHVRAVRQVVGAVRPDEQLIGEGSLVRGTAGCVEDRLVGVEGLQLASDQRIRVGPVDRFVVRRPWPLDHRVRDPPLLVEPVLTARGEFGDRVTREELGRHPAQGRLVRDGLGAVLAELRRVPVSGFGVGPRAAHAVVAADLVQLEQRLTGADDAHVLQRPLHGDRDGGNTGGLRLRLPDPQVGFVVVRAFFLVAPAHVDLRSLSASGPP